MRKGKSKVAWEVVCLPKDEGSLGLRRLDHFNKALMVSHIWKLLSLKESLWVKWVHAYMLRGRIFWDIPLRGNMSWGWRKVLQIRPLIREFVWHNIGDKALTSLWYDRWCSSSLLANSILTRDMFRVGLNPLAKSDEDGNVKSFSVSMVWRSIRPRSNKVTWVDVVWFSSCIPRHAFNLWLIVKQRLKTRDKLNSWDVSSSLITSCLLCELQPDSHEHLFFECSFSQQIWNHIKTYAGMDSSVLVFSHILASLILIAKRRSAKSIIAKLVVAACAYFIWQERNWRLFKKNKPPMKQIIDCIMNSIRLKLLSCRFKSLTMVCCSLGFGSCLIWCLSNVDGCYDLFMCY
ncbi:hypothetical protein Tco_0970076 [Tanacetum coccineum]